jgi:hypothetical protein
LFAFLSLPSMLHPPPISSSLTWSPLQCLTKCTSYEAHFWSFPRLTLLAYSL